MKTKVTQRYLRHLLKSGAASELHMDSPVNTANLRCVAISTGIYGVNGAQFVDVSTGLNWVIPSREQSLYYFL